MTQFHIKATQPDGSVVEYDADYESGFAAVNAAIKDGCGAVVAHPVKPAFTLAHVPGVANRFSLSVETLQ